MSENNFRIQTDHDERANELLNEHVQEPGDPDGLVQAEQQRQWRESHPVPSATPPAVVKRKRRWPVVLLVLVLLAGAGTGAYWLGNHSATKQQANAKKLAARATVPATTQSAAVPTTHYDSSNFTLGFDYPDGWKVSDSAAKLTVTSPAMSLVTAVGAKVDAHVVFAIQNQQTSIAGYPSGGAVASLISAKLTYKQPSAVQRAQTYLSYLSYTDANGLDALYITGDNGYQQGQQVPQSDVVQGNPLISVGFEKCAATDCSTGATNAVTLQASSWPGSAAAKDITNLIQSIVLEGS